MELMGNSESRLPPLLKNEQFTLTLEPANSAVFFLKNHNYQRSISYPRIGMVRRRDLRSKYSCSWNCGYEDWDIRKVVEHEKAEH
jgi:hypothetical protein